MEGKKTVIKNTGTLRGAFLMQKKQEVSLSD